MNEANQERTSQSDQRAVTRGAGGRIAERIVANELEVRGFHVSSLNKDGQLANADLLAAGHGKVWQVQVKGARHTPKRPMVGSVWVLHAGDRFAKWRVGIQPS
jgi:hypothetical protein